MPRNDLRGGRVPDARDLQLSSAGLEPTTYGLKVPRQDDVTSCGRGDKGAATEGAQYTPWLEQLSIAEPNLSDEQQRFILAVVERELNRSI